MKLQICNKLQKIKTIDQTKENLQKYFNFKIKEKIYNKLNKITKKLKK
jgi:hypothetical protein